MPNPYRLARNASALGLAALLAVVSLPAAAQTSTTCQSAGVLPASGPFPFTTQINTTGFASTDMKQLFTACQPGITRKVTKLAYYTFTPAVSDVYSFDTLGTTPSSDYDTVLSILAGTCNGLTPIAGACNNDSSGSSQSSVSVALAAGTTYYIAIGGLEQQNPFNPAQPIPSPGGNLVFTTKKVPINYPYSYVIPSVAKKGAFLSDVSVTNLEGADGQFTVQFLGNGGFNQALPPANQPTLANPIQISASGTKFLADVLSSFGLTDDFGAILFRSTRRLAVGAKTSTTVAAGGTSGQFVLGYDVSTGLLTQNQTGWITGLREDTAFRSNIVFVNLSASPCVVKSSAHGENGQRIGVEQSVSLPPFTMVQASRAITGFYAAPQTASAAAAVTPQAAGCLVGAVGYVIDNTSLDPFAVPMAR